MKGYYDIVGDGGSDILEQVEAQQESIARSLSGVRNLLAVGSGKGGVGKSTLTMQLLDQTFSSRISRLKSTLESSA